MAQIHFAPDYSNNALKESTVRGWKVCYLEELGKRKWNGEDLCIKTLPSTKMRMPLNLDTDLDRQVKA